MNASPHTLREELSGILEFSSVSAAASRDAIDGVEPVAIVEPETAEGVAAFLEVAAARGLRVAPRGGATKMEWGAVPRNIDVVLSTKKLNRVVEHAWGDMTATVQSGCTITTFQDVLKEHGQYLAVDPLWPHVATVGGVLATNDSGSLRIRFGALRDLVIGVTVALPGGALAKSGGKVVKNVAGYDLQKLLTGSFGTLGVITEATFRLYPVASASRTLSFTAHGFDVLNKTVLAIHDSKLTPTGVQILGGSDRKPRLDVRFEGIQASVEAQTEHLAVLTHDIEQDDFSSRTWSARQHLFEGAINDHVTGSPGSIVCKVTVLPNSLSRLFSMVTSVTSTVSISWGLVAQSIGICTLRLEGVPVQACIDAVSALRQELAGIGGSLTVLRCPPCLKPAIDVWGPIGDAIPLMRRVKNLFDPTGVLNPGRFVGGI